MWAFVCSIVVQAALIVLGVAYIVTAAADAAVGLLLVWCSIGTLYGIGVWSVLAAASRWAETDEPPIVLELSAPSRAISLIATILASAVGVVANIQHTLLDPGDQNNLLVNGVGIWAMLLAWMLLHWGFAQLYLQRYYRSSDRPLRFPGTDAPGILEFAYFSYTVGVSLAASDVEVRDRAMRWRVLLQSVSGFFFNGVIIVTALEAIKDGLL